MCLSCKDIARQKSCDGAQMSIICILYFSASRVQRISDLHSKFALRHTMCGSMVDMQSPTAEIRRGKKEERKKKETTKQKYNGHIGRP